MPHKTRKHCKSQRKYCNTKSKKITHLKCIMKTCRATKYKSVYGGSANSIRSNTQLFK